MKKILFFLVIVHLIFNIENCMSQWVQISNGIPIASNAFSLAVIGNTIFAGLDYGLGVYKTTNNGTNWTQTALNYRRVNSLLAVANNLYAGTDSGIFITSNNGTSWIHSSMNGKRVLDITANGNTIFAGTNENGLVPTGVYLSTNNGIDWIQTTLNNKWVYSLAVFNNMIFAGTSSGLFISTDNGANWMSIPNTFGTILSFAAIGNTIFAGIANYPVGYGGVRMSTNNGTNWSYTSFTQETVFALTAYGNELFAGTSISGIFYTTNYGTNWLAINQGLPTTTVEDLLIANNYIFAATASTSIWRRPLSEIVGIQIISSEIQSVYSLSQNFPNPFNPVTKIKFDITQHTPYPLSRGETVNLKVFDITGKEVTTLVNEQLQPGIYEVTFDGSAFASGIYFYQLRTNNFTATKKLILLK